MANSSRGARVQGPAKCIFRGELDTVGLSTLLTILQMERRSGMLIVQRGRHLGRVWVREGRVVRARIASGEAGSARRSQSAGGVGNPVAGPERDEGARRAGGGEAVYQLLGWADGQFELWQASVEGPDEIGASTPFLLMEAARRTDEARGMAAPQSAATDAAW